VPSGEGSDPSWLVFPEGDGLPEELAPAPPGAAVPAGDCWLGEGLGLPVEEVMESEGCVS